MRPFSFLLLVASALPLGMPLGIATAAADQLDRIKDRGKIVVGIKNDYKPFGFLGPDGKLNGLEIELARFVGARIAGSPDKVELVPVVASNRIEFLNQGRIDVIIATLGRTEERAKVIDYSKDYYMLPEGAVATPRNSKINGWADLKGAKLCGILGNSFNKVLSEKYGASMSLFQGTAEMFRAFEDNRCDAIGFDEPLLRQKVADDSWKDKYVIRIPADSFIPLGAGVKKGEKRLLEAVNAGIRDAEASGLLRSAEKRFDMGETSFVAAAEAEAKAR